MSSQNLNSNNISTSASASTLNSPPSTSLSAAAAATNAAAVATSPASVGPILMATTSALASTTISPSTSLSANHFSQQINPLDVQKQRLDQLIELISNQDAKLNCLKALKNVTKDQTAINLELNKELKSINNSINEKDCELRQALNRVDNLNRQLINYRRLRAHRKKLFDNSTGEIGGGSASEDDAGTFSNKATTKTVTTSTTTINNNNYNNNNNTNNNNNNINSNSNSNSNANNNGVATRRVSFDPLALLLDAALEGELDLVIQTSKQVPDLNASHDECVTALHNAVVAGHYDVAKFLIEAGCDVNVQDSDGWSPLHCAASCNNLPLIKLLIENNALVYATTTSGFSTPLMKCEEIEENFEECYNYLTKAQNSLGVINDGIVYALYDYEAQKDDELSFARGDELIILRKDDSQEQAWWWAKKRNVQTSDNVTIDTKEGYIPRNLVGLYPPKNATSYNSNSLSKKTSSSSISDNVCNNPINKLQF